MSGHLDPARPNPPKSPHAFYNFWEGEVTWGFSRLEWERLCTDAEAASFSSQLTDAAIYERLLHRQQLAQTRLDLSRFRNHLYSISKPFEDRWRSLIVRARGKVLEEALAWMCDGGIVSEDSWLSCPELTKKEMCGGNGEGLIKILEHFIVTDLSKPPPLDFPPLHDERVRILYGLPKEGEEDFPRPAAIRGMLDMVVVNRNLFLCMAIMYTVAKLCDLSITTTIYQRKDYEQRDPAESTLESAFDHFGELPDRAWTAIEKERIEYDKKRKVLKEACQSCKKPPIDPKKKMLICSGCKAIDRRVTYCSRECQVKDYKLGSPPHRNICGKKLRHLDPSATMPAAPVDDFPLYTKKPSAKLTLQLYYLRREGPSKWEYHYTMLPSALPLHKGVTTLDGSGKADFVRVRNQAIAKKDLVCIAKMEAWLVACVQPGGIDTREGWEKQLEMEFEVDLKECRKAAEKDLEYLALKKMVAVFL